MSEIELFKIVQFFFHSSTSNKSPISKYGFKGGLINPVYATKLGTALLEETKENLHILLKGTILRV